MSGRETRINNSLPLRARAWVGGYGRWGGGGGEVGGGERDKAFCFEPYVNKRDRGDTERGGGGETDRHKQSQGQTETERESPIILTLSVHGKVVCLRKK